MAIKILYCVYGKFVLNHRYVLTLMLFLSVVCFYSMRLCLHIALTKIAMPTPVKKEVQEEVCPGNNTQILEGGSYNWSEKDQGIILLSFFPGYILTHVPGGLLADKIGGKPILSTCVIVSVLVTFLTPVVIMNLHWAFLVVLRFILGIVQGPSFPAIATLLAAWVPRQERSTLVGLVFSGVFLGSVTGNLVSGLLMAHLKSWPVVFYAWGIISVFWCVGFQVLCYSRPSLHPYITDEEKEYLEREIGPVKSFKTPWKAILTDSAVLSLIIIQAGHDWITYTFIVDLPKFFNDVLKLDIGYTGMATAISFGLMWIFSIICGWISDFLINREIMTIIQMRKLYGIISSLGPCLCSVLATYMGCNQVLVITWLWIGMILMGPWFPGPKVNNLDITLHFTGIVMALSNGTGVLSGIITPYLVAVIAPDGTLRQWQLVFWVSFIVCTASTVVFVVWGSGTRSKWDYVEDE
ncbi:hypothetical protein ILUMI_02770 [Ignelater luminosus]|uniref:Major facilitator superfamily (MFS) profile domain-containing protein n=1 Tax=Ignelater luminosus TaxID=2038154 RepID=A0A8K0GIZ3_IGNLU|nr:hypothetical protein ILUMI_02770 [Ignelater luminosus]